MPKTGTVIFISKSWKFVDDIKLKLNRKRLYLNDNVKYLGIKIDGNVNWKHRLNNILVK